MLEHKVVFYRFEKKNEINQSNNDFYKPCEVRFAVKGR